jgi:hypothetical protein
MFQVQTFKVGVTRPNIGTLEAEVGGMHLIEGIDLFGLKSGYLTPERLDPTIELMIPLDLSNQTPFFGGPSFLNDRFIGHVYCGR